MHTQQQRPLFKHMVSHWSQLLYVLVAWLFALCIVVVAGSLRWPVLAAFHPVNAVVMFWVTVTVARQAQRWREERAGTH